MTDYLQASIQLLTAIKLRQETEELLASLESISVEDLAKDLDNDVKRMVFWINVYNSFILMLLRKNPELYDNRKAFFTEPRFTVAGRKMSFDDIEHGILRRSKIKYSLGYVNKPLVSEFEKMMRVNEVDWRLHVALNCGASSCPPIEIYTMENLNEQLDHRAKLYLAETTELDLEKNQVIVTALMQMFRGDFGGPDGIRKILKSYDIIPESTRPSISYHTYDWGLALENFVE